MPPVTSLLKREHWSTSIKTLLAGIVSVGIAVAALAIAGDFGHVHLTGLYLLQTAPILFTASQIAYMGFKDSGPDRTLTAVFNRRPAPRPPSPPPTPPAAVSG